MNDIYRRAERTQVVGHAPVDPAAIQEHLAAKAAQKTGEEL